MTFVACGVLSRHPDIGVASASLIAFSGRPANRLRGDCANRWVRVSTWEDLAREAPDAGDPCEWEGLACRPREAWKAVRAGLTASEARRWQEALGLTVQEATRWASWGFGLDEAREWMAVEVQQCPGVTARMTSGEAASWQHDGFTPAQAAAWAVASAGCKPRGRSLFEHARRCAVEYRAHGFGPKDMQSVSFQAALGWSDDGSTLRQHTRMLSPARLRRFMDATGLPVNLAGDCLRAKVSVKAARAARERLLSGEVTPGHLNPSV